ncbi:MAG: hypothetical protein K6G04_02000 [Lachnospiraceae bacterium]|nr:hypothetical protein [Lachnospiraceae bacterium]
MNKSKLRINCDLCDARNIKEETYGEYQEITICADTIVTNERSKEILARLPMNLTVDEYVNCTSDEEIAVKSINGSYEIAPNTGVVPNTWLTVNGMVRILPHTEAQLQKISHLTINGVVFCPNGLSGMLPPMTTNGTIINYPDDYTILANELGIDRYFPLRAEEGGRYFIPKCVYDLDLETDYTALATKNVKMQSKKLYLREEHLEAALPLFNMDAELAVIPTGYHLVTKDATLDQNLISTNGTKLYIAGDLRIGENGRALFDQMEALTVEGDVRIPEALVDDFSKVNATYGKLIAVSDARVNGIGMLNINKSFMDSVTSKTTISDCGMVTISADVAPEEITEYLSFHKCGVITCSSEQKAAVTAASSSCGLIKSSAGDFIQSLGDMVSSVTEGVFDMDGINFHSSDTKVINADTYVL